MPIIWSAERDQRLLCAIIAAHPDFRPDFTLIAGMFGQGCTHDSVDHRFRKIRAAAVSMRLEAGTPPPPRRRSMAGGKSNLARSLKEEIEDLKDDNIMKRAGLNRTGLLQKGLGNWRDTEAAKRRDKKKMEGLKDAEFAKRLQRLDWGIISRG
ncbi:hypothetical protein FPQ18DRAFT_396507 [Pyronema domesticum]|nr:hypothetical protein FPQ18DRAFT_396507 [Pyronema domesticum]